MLLSTLSRQVVPLASRHSTAMICAVSSPLPLAGASAPRRATPAPSAPVRPRLFGMLSTRASTGGDRPQQAHPDATEAASQGGQELQVQRGGQAGGQLAARGGGGDLLNLPMMMPVPFRRMADHMMQMQCEMDSLMSAFGMPSPLVTAMADPFDIFDRAAAPLVARRAGGLGRVVALAVDEDDKGYTVKAEVPGFDKNEIKVSLSEDGMLTMTGTHEERSLEAGSPQQEGSNGKQQQRTTGRRYASFVRSVQLPDDADDESITAATQNGVLTVHIPKTPKPTPKVREIPVA